MAQDALSFLTEEALHTAAYGEDTPDLRLALNDLASEFSTPVVDEALVQRAIGKASNLAKLRRTHHRQTVRVRTDHLDLD